MIKLFVDNKAFKPATLIYGQWDYSRSSIKDRFCPVVLTESPIASQCLLAHKEKNPITFCWSMMRPKS